MAGRISHLTKKSGIAAMITALMLSLLIPLSFASCSSEEEASAAAESEWGVGLTENIPEFEHEAESYDFGNGDYAAAYYNNVASENIDKYIAKLESDLGIKFSQERYPKIADYGERIIAIHYNVTEMRLSVTVAQKENIDN